MSHREFAIHEEWLIREWNRPSRTDYYLMKVMQVLVQVNSKRGAVLPNLDKFKIPFDFTISTAVEAKADPDYIKTVTAVARAKHLEGNSAPITHKTREKPLEPIQPSRN